MVRAVLEVRQEDLVHNRLFIVLATAVCTAPGCATKGLVRGTVGHVNEKVDSLGQALEETQDRTARTEKRIGQVDRKIDGVSRTAADARRAAKAASATADKAGSRIERLDASSRRLVYDINLSEDQGRFAFGGAELPESARARIDELVSELVANPSGVYIEIEGHTDDVGSIEANRRLGLQRAEAAKRYIHERHSVPLHKINVISFGEERPLAPNRSEEGRARNRRIVIRVLS
jgi:outer membrane protein OmpA-like peptidoglycan-associated protein